MLLVPCPVKAPHHFRWLSAAVWPWASSCSTWWWSWPTPSWLTPPSGGYWDLCAFPIYSLFSWWWWGCSLFSIYQLILSNLSFASTREDNLRLRGFPLLIKVQVVMIWLWWLPWSWKQWQWHRLMKLWFLRRILEHKVCVKPGFNITALHLAGYASAEEYFEWVPRNVLLTNIFSEKECPQNHQHFLEDGVNSTTQHMVGPAIQVKATQYSVPT